MDDNTKYIDVVVERSMCVEHKSQKGSPCWALETSLGNLMVGICNRRAKNAGFVGQINPKSLSKR